MRQHGKKYWFLFSFFSYTFFTLSYAGSTTPIRVSVLEFGTVNWTLTTIKSNQLDIKNGFELIIQPLASTQAGKIALHTGAADIIVSDWMWVARQRGMASDYLFAPYSSTAGAVVVDGQSTITDISHLVGKRLGIAGGPLDKNWLLLRALALKKGVNLDNDVEKIFAAPPLLSHLIQQGKLDALINFWHYNARLKADGYRQLLDTHDIIHQLGIDATLPILGYVFSQSWGNSQAIMINRFLSASRQAADLLCHSDQHWAAIVPLTRTADVSTQALLRQDYCNGRVKPFTPIDTQAIARVYSILSDIGGKDLVGSNKLLDSSLFWNESYER
ncbi:MAG: ABC transporter substrate-binding protein [Cycloclasticus sp.]|nr:ABC transporter substrate-binding protein [Cycloclasticus sp.]MBQ0790025.1 ABC transporter substrate-binding protein [Cycloclasticus sp.]